MLYNVALFSPWAHCGTMYCYGEGACLALHSWATNTKEPGGITQFLQLHIFLLHSYLVYFCPEHTCPISRHTRVSQCSRKGETFCMEQPLDFYEPDVLPATLPVMSRQHRKTQWFGHLLGTVNAMIFLGEAWLPIDTPLLWRI